MLQVQAVRAFDDNYIWVLDEDKAAVAIVDPGDADPVLSYLQQTHQSVSAVLITHKHYDHVGGIAQIKAAYPDALVFGPAGEPIQGLDHKLQAGESVSIPDMQFSPVVMDVPGHTEGHIAYLGEGALFCGDTLFACGCGRVFSGTMGQLHRSLEQISALPGDTRLYCAHEYTLDNIGFAKWVEPHNQHLLEREQQVTLLRQKGLPTVPSVLETELQTNPFLRVGQRSVIEAAERHAGHRLESSEAVFTELRQWKDREYD
jgi:hydroxyacylglutathione hydrolase